MKNLLKIVLITILIAGAIGGGYWLFANYKSPKTLYKANCDFIVNNDTESLIENMSYAQTLYDSIVPSDRRIETLNIIISKIDNFEQDLNAYLVLSTANAKSTKSLSREYSSLTKSRKSLITNYEEYIDRMSGNTQADGPMLQQLYNDLFVKTVKYLRDYNNCFGKTTNYVFTKVYNADSIKHQLYTLYSCAVTDLLNNITNNQFNSVVTITRLNSGINLENNNIKIKNNVSGGEFSTNALNFKKYFNSSNLTTLVSNFNTYYGLTINPITETSNEKLAVYYAKLILEV